MPPFDKQSQTVPFDIIKTHQRGLTNDVAGDDLAHGTGLKARVSLRAMADNLVKKGRKNAVVRDAANVQSAADDTSSADGEEVANWNGEALGEFRKKLHDEFISYMRKQKGGSQSDEDQLLSSITKFPDLNNDELVQRLAKAVGYYGGREGEADILPAQKKQLAAQLLYSLTDEIDWPTRLATPADGQVSYSDGVLHNATDVTISDAATQIKSNIKTILTDELGEWAALMVDQIAPVLVNDPTLFLPATAETNIRYGSWEWAQLWTGIEYAEGVGLDPESQTSEALLALGQAAIKEPETTVSTDDTSSSESASADAIDAESAEDVPDTVAFRTVKALTLVARAEGKLSGDITEENQEAVNKIIQSVAEELFKEEFAIAEAFETLAKDPPLTGEQLARTILKDKRYDPDETVTYITGSARGPVQHKTTLAEYYFNENNLDRFNISVPKLLGEDGEFDKRFNAYAKEFATAMTAVIDQSIALYARKNNLNLEAATITVSRPTITGWAKSIRGVVSNALITQVSNTSFFITITPPGSGTPQQFALLLTEIGKGLQEVPSETSLADWTNTHRDKLFSPEQLKAVKEKIYSGYYRDPEEVFDKTDIGTGNAAEISDKVLEYHNNEVQKAYSEFRGQTRGEAIANFFLNLIPFRSLIVAIQKGDTVGAIISGAFDILSFIPFIGQGLKAFQLAGKAAAAGFSAVLKNTLKEGLAKGLSLGLKAVGSFGREFGGQLLKTVATGVESALPIPTPGFSSKFGFAGGKDAARVIGELKATQPGLADVLEQVTKRSEVLDAAAAGQQNLAKISQNADGLDVIELDAIHLSLGSDEVADLDGIKLIVGRNTDDELLFLNKHVGDVDKVFYTLADPHTGLSYGPRLWLNEAGWLVAGTAEVGRLGYAVNEAVTEPATPKDSANLENKELSKQLGWDKIREKLIVGSGSSPTEDLPDDPSGPEPPNSAPESPGIDETAENTGNEFTPNPTQTAGEAGTQDNDNSEDGSGNAGAQDKSDESEPANNTGDILGKVDWAEVSKHLTTAFLEYEGEFLKLQNEKDDRIVATYFQMVSNPMAFGRSLADDSELMLSLAKESGLYPDVTAVSELAAGDKKELVRALLIGLTDRIFWADKLAADSANSEAVYYDGTKLQNVTGKTVKEVIKEVDAQIKDILNAEYGDGYANLVGLVRELRTALIDDPLLALGPDVEDIVYGSSTWKTLQKGIDAARRFGIEPTTQRVEQLAAFAAVDGKPPADEAELRDQLVKVFVAYERSRLSISDYTSGVDVFEAFIDDCVQQKAQAGWFDNDSNLMHILALASGRFSKVSADFKLTPADTKELSEQLVRGLTAAVDWDSKLDQYDGQPENRVFYDGVRLGNADGLSLKSAAAEIDKAIKKLLDVYFPEYKEFPQLVQEIKRAVVDDPTLSLQQLPDDILYGSEQWETLFRGAEAAWNSFGIDASSWSRHQLRGFAALTDAPAHNDTGSDVAKRLRQVFLGYERSRLGLQSDLKTNEVLAKLVQEDGSTSSSNYAELSSTLLQDEELLACLADAKGLHKVASVLTEAQKKDLFGLLLVGITQDAIDWKKELGPQESNSKDVYFDGYTLHNATTLTLAEAAATIENRVKQILQDHQPHLASLAYELRLALVNDPALALPSPPPDILYGSREWMTLRIGIKAAWMSGQDPADLSKDQLLELGHAAMNASFLTSAGEDGDASQTGTEATSTAGIWDSYNIAFLMAHAAGKLDGTEPPDKVEEIVNAFAKQRLESVVELANIAREMFKPSPTLEKFAEQLIKEAGISPNLKVKYRYDKIVPAGLLNSKYQPVEEEGVLKEIIVDFDGLGVEIIEAAGRDPAEINSKLKNIGSLHKRLEEEAYSWRDNYIDAHSKFLTAAIRNNAALLNEDWQNANITVSEMSLRDSPVNIAMTPHGPSKEKKSKEYLVSFSVEGETRVFVLFTSHSAGTMIEIPSKDGKPSDDWISKHLGLLFGNEYQDYDLDIVTSFHAEVVAASNFEKLATSIKGYYKDKAEVITYDVTKSMVDVLKDNIPILGSIRAFHRGDVEGGTLSVLIDALSLIPIAGPALKWGGAALKLGTVALKPAVAGAARQFAGATAKLIAATLDTFNPVPLSPSVSTVGRFSSKAVKDIAEALSSASSLAPKLKKAAKLAEMAETLDIPTPKAINPANFEGFYLAGKNLSDEENLIGSINNVAPDADGIRNVDGNFYIDPFGDGKFVQVKLDLGNSTPGLKVWRVVDPLNPGKAPNYYKEPRLFKDPSTGEWLSPRGSLFGAGQIDSRIHPQQVAGSSQKPGQNSGILNDSSWADLANALRGPIDHTYEATLPSGLVNEAKVYFVLKPKFDQRKNITGYTTEVRPLAEASKAKAGEIGFTSYWLSYESAGKVMNGAEIPFRDIPKKPSGSDPQYVFTPAFSGCSFLITKSPADADKFRVYHFPNGTRLSDRKRFLDKIGVSESDILDEYGWYRYGDDDYPHAFAGMRYDEAVGWQFFSTKYADSFDSGRPGIKVPPTGKNIPIGTKTPLLDELQSGLTTQQITEYRLAQNPGGVLGNSDIDKLKGMSGVGRVHEVDGKHYVLIKSIPYRVEGPATEGIARLIHPTDPNAPTVAMWFDGTGWRKVQPNQDSNGWRLVNEKGNLGDHLVPTDAAHFWWRVEKPHSSTNAHAIEEAGTIDKTADFLANKWKESEPLELQTTSKGPRGIDSSGNYVDLVKGKQTKGIEYYRLKHPDTGKPAGEIHIVEGGKLHALTVPMDGTGTAIRKLGDEKYVLFNGELFRVEETGSKTLLAVGPDGEPIKWSNGGPIEFNADGSIRGGLQGGAGRGRPGPSWSRGQEQTLSAEDQALVEDLRKRGRYVPKDIAAIDKKSNGAIIYVTRTSLDKHILPRHGVEFRGYGVQESELPGLILKALKENNIVEYQNPKHLTPRPVYSIQHGDYELRIAISVDPKTGSAYGANPAGRYDQDGNFVPPDYSFLPSVSLAE